MGQPPKVQKWSFQKATRFAQIRIEQGNKRFNVIDLGDAKRKRLAGTGQLCVSDVDVM